MDWWYEDEKKTHTDKSLPECAQEKMYIVYKLKKFNYGMIKWEQIILFRFDYFS